MKKGNTCIQVLSAEKRQCEILRLLEQCAGVIIDLSGLSIEPADSSWCDEVGSEAHESRRKEVSPVELRELRSITFR
jgi:hypothetical protein